MKREKQKEDNGKKLTLTQMVTNMWVNSKVIGNMASDMVKGL